MLIWTTDPHRALWDRLTIWSNKASVQRFLLETTRSARQVRYPPGDILERKSRQVAHSIAQAAEYYAAADRCSISTSPLLYFYGMLSLAKALIIANRREVFLDDIRYHGLHSRPRTPELEAYASNESRWSLDSEFALANMGVFEKLRNLSTRMRHLMAEFTVQPV